MRFQDQVSMVNARLEEDHGTVLSIDHIFELKRPTRLIYGLRYAP